MKVLVCGGRLYSDKKVVDDSLTYVHTARPITQLIQGGARGADRLGKEWGILNQIPVRVFMADWDQYGKGAGVIRNKQMLEEGKPDLVIAFPGGNGTDNMIAISLAANVLVWKVE